MILLNNHGEEAVYLTALDVVQTEQIEFSSLIVLKILEKKVEEQLGIGENKETNVWMYCPLHNISHMPGMIKGKFSGIVAKDNFQESIRRMAVKRLCRWFQKLF